MPEEELFFYMCKLLKNLKLYKLPIVFLKLLQELLDKKEFDLVCDAVDKLVDEGRLHFDHSLGKLVINENVLPVDPDATSPGPHDDD